jgi:SAM-dependent methyltransferase
LSDDDKKKARMAVMSHEYPEFVARFYDVVYGSVRDGVDNAYYLRRALMSSGPVLELGVGTGRLFASALERGADVYGVDVSATMVERLRSKLEPRHHDRVFVADAVTMRLDRRFQLVLAPFRMLSHVLGVGDQLRLLANVHDHLLPGGELVFDVYVPSPRILAEGLRGALDFEGEYAPGRSLRRTSSVEADVVNQIAHVAMTFVWNEEGEEKRADWSFDLRFFHRFELEHLVARSPLELLSIHGDFKEGPLRSGSRDFVVVCRRPKCQRFNSKR